MTVWCAQKTGGGYMGNELFNICDGCGKKDSIARGITHHTFGGYAGYGSRYDGEYITLTFCSACLDKMIEAKSAGERQDSRR